MTSAPVASRIAFAIAAAVGTIGGSPRPFEPRFVRCSSGTSTRSQTISGTSAIVGSLYASSVFVSTVPVRGSSSRCSENVCPSAWMIPPSIWLRAPSGLITRPTSWIATTFSTRTSPVPTSTATSASWIPNVSTRIPVGFGPRAPLPRIWPSSSRPVISSSGQLPPSEQTMLPPRRVSVSSGRSNRCAASSTTWRAASAAAERTAGPIEGSVDEPPEIDANGPRAESPICTSTRSSGRPSSSAAIIAIAVRVPVPMSCIAVTTFARPSEPSRTQA